jgi:hypothetical protein
MAVSESSRILRVGSTHARRFRSSLSFPPPPRPSLLGFHRAHLSLRDQTYAEFLANRFDPLSETGRTARLKELAECGATAMPRTQEEMCVFLSGEIAPINHFQQMDFAL